MDAVLLVGRRQRQQRRQRRQAAGSLWCEETRPNGERWACCCRFYVRSAASFVPFSRAYPKCVSTTRAPGTDLELGPCACESGRARVYLSRARVGHGDKHEEEQRKTIHKNTRHQRHDSPHCPFLFFSFLFFSLHCISLPFPFLPATSNVHIPFPPFSRGAPAAAAKGSAATRASPGPLSAWPPPRASGSRRSAAPIWGGGGVEKGK